MNIQKRIKKFIYIIILTTLLILTVFLLFGYFYNPASKELRRAYERFREEATQADINLDSTQLSQVATGEVLRGSIASIEQLKKFPEIRVSSEAEIGIYFRVLELEDEYARIKTNVSVRDFTQNPNTGERTYSSRYARYYTIWAKMVKEEGVWKVSEIESKERDW